MKSKVGSHSTSGKSSDAILRTVYEHVGWKVHEPSARMSGELDKEIKKIKAGKSKYKAFTGKIAGL